MIVPRRWLPILIWPKAMLPNFVLRRNRGFPRAGVVFGGSGLEQSASTATWLTTIVWAGAVLIAISPVMADDDPPTTRSQDARSPNGRSFRTRSPGTDPPPTKPTAASSDRSDAHDAGLPTIVDKGGRRTLTIERVPPAGTPAEPVRPTITISQIDSATPWHFEKLYLTNATEYQGLLLRTTPGELGEVEFAHITQRPGKPMSAIVRVIPRGDVKRFDRLPPDQHDVLVARFHSFRQRATFEARNMKTISLRTRDGRLVYDGQWFQLKSTADSESTRRCVVRIEQMFAGFRQLLPRRVEPQSQLQIELLGSMDEFRGQLRSLNLDIKNPAFFSLAENKIVAGGDLSRFGGQLSRIRVVHEERLRRFNKLETAFKKRLATISQEMLAGGFLRQEIKVELALRRTTWREQKTQLQRDIKEANRRNDTAFAEVTNRMLRRLYHEGFHAYLENFVFPHREFHVERWLNEGLAQIFENGRFDVEVLRLDAPDPELLARLQQDLVSQNPLRLVQFLTAADPNFLVRHANDNTDRRYLYAWGVAYFLAFERDLLDSDVLTNYVVPVSRAGSELARFEKLVGEPLDEFEIRWRDYMLKLQSPR